MAVFDGIAKKLSRASQDAVKNTKDLTDIAKYNTLIVEEQRILGETYSKIGMKFHERFPDTKEVEFTEFCAIVNQCLENMEKYSAEVIRLKGLKTCTNCGNRIGKDMMFCGNCGLKVEFEPVAGLEDPVAEEQPVEASAPAQFCAGCGTKVESDAKFCRGCGNKIGG